MAHAQVQNDARASLQRAVEFSFDNQKPDGHWAAEVSADVSFTSEYVMFKYAMGLDLKSDGDALRRWLLQEQNEDGSWGLAPKLPGNVSTTTEAYLALKILGVSPDGPSMLRTKEFMIRSGGVAKVRFFTRFFLATFGLFPWSAIPQLPVELILMPASSPINIYVLASWARSTLIPVLIVRHHEPLYALPNGSSPKNTFLDELWCDPGNKNVPFAPPLSTLFWERDFVQFGFTAIDKIIAQLGGLKHFPLRGLSRKKCVDWLIEHQESVGDWAGFFPPMHGSVWALIMEGFPLDHKAVRLGLESLERLSVTDARGKRIPPTVSPVWDTALMVNALCDAGFNENILVQKAIDWIKDRQLLGPQGDWRIYSPNKQAGGWSFEYANTWYPDVDDTAVVVMGLIKHDPYSIGSECVSNAVQWILGMHNHDGGWGAFDYNNDKLWLHKIPFSDMDSLCDPSSADITGRVLECFGLLLSHRKGSLDRTLLQQVQVASERGIAYLLSEQEAFGAWWGRWGNNYNYGTGNVLRGFVHFAHNAKVQKSVGRATRWFESVQNTDGGWGEDLKSYNFPEMAGRGESTAAQTAWAILALQPYRRRSDPGIEKGIRWLVSNQSVKSEHGASWDTEMYTATGFPNVLYLGYPYYHHFFPIMALTKYVQGNDEASFKAIELSPQIVEQLNRPTVLLMVIGSRGDIQVFLNIAKLLATSYEYHVRIATHPAHKTLVEKAGVEFYSVGGSPGAFADYFTEKPNILFSAIKGELGSLRRSFNIMIGRYWRSSIDSNSSTDSTGKVSHRPFLADTIVSSLPTLVHVHCAEKLQVPLVLVSVQPLLPTSDFPHVFTMIKPKFSTSFLWNYLSFFCMELLNWLVFGSHLNYLRVKEYGMSSLSWTWAAYDFLNMKTPHVCLWSPHVLPRPFEWDTNVTIAGYTFDDGTSYHASPALESFLNTDKPMLAIGFGSATIPDPVKLMTTIFTAVETTGAKAVVCLNSFKLGSALPIPDHIFLVEEIPHSWLLPRVQGFVHHGGAGSTAAGLKAGVPMLLVPFFLDQNFWAAKTHQLKLSPPPLDHRNLNPQNLAAALKDLLSHNHQHRCTTIASHIASEKDGAEVAAETIYRAQTSNSLPRCSIIPALHAHWHHPSSGLHLSGAAAACLTSHQILSWTDLALSKSPSHNPISSSRNRTTPFPPFLAPISHLFWLVIRLVSLLSRACVEPFSFSLWGATADREGGFMAAERDPVREARVRQAEWDLGVVGGWEGVVEGGVEGEEKGSVEGVEKGGAVGGEKGGVVKGRKEGGGLEERIVANWVALRRERDLEVLEKKTDENE